MRIGSPLSLFNIIHVAHTDEHPGSLLTISLNVNQREKGVGYRETEPSNKSMMLFEGVMICTVQDVSHQRIECMEEIPTCEPKEMHSRQKQ